MNQIFTIKKTLLCSVCLHMFLMVNADAQSIAQNSNEEELITDQLEDEFGDFYGSHDFISIATGSQKTLVKAPAIASVITAEQIKQSGARKIIDALKMVPGLHISQNSQAMAPKFQFRGITSTFAPQTLLMINGIPTKSAVRGDNHIVWGEFPINSVSRIEIIRGPGSALYGADAFAGVINIITKDVQELSLTDVGAGIGTQNSKSAWFNTGFMLDDFELGVSMEFLSSDGLGEVIERDAQTAIDEIAAGQGFSSVSYAPGHTNTGFDAFDLLIDSNFKRLSLNIMYQDRTDVGTGQGISEALDPVGKIGGYKLLVDLSYELPTVSDDWNVKTQLSYYGSEQAIEKNINLLPPGTLFGAFPNGVIGNPGWKEKTTRFEISADYFGINSHNMTISSGYVEQDLYQVTETKNFLPDLTPSPVGIIDVTDTPDIFTPESKRHSQFILLQDIWQLAPDWELTTGIRYDHYSDFGTTMNPRLSLVWSSSLKSNTKFLIGQAYRAPNFAELLSVNNPVSIGNPDLKPEHIDSFELAYNYRHDDNHTSSINFFYYKIEDFITFVPDAGRPTNTAQNVGERTGYGLEIETGFSPNKNVSVKANYSYVKAQDDNIRDDVGDYPNHLLKAQLLWQINQNWRLYSDANLVGTRKRSPMDARSDLDGFNEVGLNLQYTTNNGYQLSLSVENLFNENIREPSTGPSIQNGPVNIPFDIPLGSKEVMLRVSKSL